MVKDRKLVAFHKDTFEMYMAKYNKKKELEKVITEKAKDLLGDYKFKPSDLFPIPSASIFIPQANGIPVISPMPIAS